MRGAFFDLLDWKLKGNIFRIDMPHIIPYTFFLQKPSFLKPIQLLYIMDRSPPSLVSYLGAKLLATCRAVVFKRNPVPSRPQQPPGCLVLRRLTMEMMLFIVEHLSATDKVVLAQTCSQFRSILRESTQTYLPAGTLTAREHADYLFRISRDNPDSWACEKCHAVHVFHPRDTPDKMDHLACPWSKTRVTLEDRFFLIPEWPHYRHVHIALKLLRQEVLSVRQSRYLADLLRNSHGVGFTCPSRPSFGQTYEYYPKVAQERFLLKVVQRFEDPTWDSSDLFLHGPCLVYFSACAHQIFRHKNLTSGWTHVRRRKHQRLRKQNPGSYSYLPNEDIETAVEMAYTRMGDVIQRSCPQCPTDFTVQIWRTKAVLCTWSDLGGETPLDKKRLDSYRLHFPSSGHPCWSDGVEHEPGVVKKLYELEE